MPRHLVAWYESMASNGALVNVTAVPDPAIFVSGNDVRVPAGLKSMLWAFAGTSQTGSEYAKISSPTLRLLAPQTLAPLQTGPVSNDENQVLWFADNPRDVTPNESLDAAVFATDATAAATAVIAELADAAPTPAKGKIFTMRATGAAALVAGQWVNTPITFDEVLPAGTYQVVGCQAFGSNLIAARFVFPGAGFRPGLPGCAYVGVSTFRQFMDGNLGVWGEFDSNAPPTLDALGVTDTTQELLLQLIQK